MAIYHASLSYFSRRAGKFVEKGVEEYKHQSRPREGGFSSVAAAAYRAGCQLTDRKTGEVHDYRAKAGVLSSFLLGPKGIGGYTRESLWNAAEAAEKRVDARVAYEWDIALPRELTHEQREALARELAQDLVKRYGAAVDASIHLPPKGGNPYNHHCHMLMTTRAINDDGSWAANKLRVLSCKKTGATEVEWFRAQVELRTNAALKAAGHDVRISRLTYKEQGIDKKPGKHEGRNATNARRRGQKPAGMNDNELTRHQENLQAGAAALFTARERIDLAKKEMAANNAALEERLERERAAAVRHRPVRMPRMPASAMRGRPSDERFMIMIAMILGELLSDMFTAMIATRALSAMADQQAKEAREIRTLRRHSSQLKGEVKRWQKILEDGQAAQARAELKALNDKLDGRRTHTPRKAGYASPEKEAIITAAAAKRTRPQKKWRPPNTHIYSFTEKMIKEQNAAVRRRRRRRRKDWENGGAAPPAPE